MLRSSAIRRNGALLVRCERSVFCARPVGKAVKITMDDVRDAIEASRGLREQDARDYMLGCGLDYDNVRKYWCIVSEYESAYKMAQERDRQQAKAVWIKKLWLLIAIIIHVLQQQIV